MNCKKFLRLVALIALPLCFSAQGSASSLQGKVVEVLDGERLTVVSVNQSLKVKILGIAAPAGNQAFAAVAKQHLQDLVGGKYVAVHYTSLGADGVVLGRVVAKDMDVGAQMIRDGVAWYQKSEASTLADTEKETYARSEQAARNEVRGLWSDPSPVAPWEFRWEQAANSNLISRSQTLVAKSGKGDRQPLSNDELFRSLSGHGRLGIGLMDEGDAGWKTLSPSPGKFSVYVPGDAKEFGAILPLPTGQTVETNYCVGRRGRKLYLVVWAKGPNELVSDEGVADDTANGFVFGLQRGVGVGGDGSGFKITRQRSVRLGPYSGAQYLLSGPATFGTIRVFAKRSGQVREIFLMVALNATEEDAQVREFFGSLNIKGY